MGPGQGNNAGAGVGDAPRQAFFCNEKGSHLRIYTAHSETFHSGSHRESHWLPNTTTLFLRPNATGEMWKVVFWGTHIITKYTFLSTVLGIFLTSSPHASVFFHFHFPITGTPSPGNLVAIQWEEEGIREMGLHLARLTRIVSPIIFRILENIEKDFHYRKLMKNLTYSGTSSPTIDNIYLHY